MKRYFLGYGLFLCLLGSLSPVHAQNFLKDYRRLVAHYTALRECSLRVKSLLYTHADDETPKMLIRSESKFNETAQWAKTNHLEMLYTAHCVLVVDHLKKQVQYSRPVDLKEVRKQTDGGFLDTTLIKQYAVAHKGQTEGVTEYELTALRTGTEYIRIIYKIGIPDYRFREITYYYDDKGPYKKVKVLYEYFDGHPVFSKATFSEDRILVNRGEAAALTRAYAGYTLLNGYTQNLKKILNDE